MNLRMERVEDTRNTGGHGLGSKGNEFHLQPLQSLAEQYPMYPDSQGREDHFPKVDYVQRGQRYQSHVRGFEET